MLKSPILRPRPLAKLVNQAWRASAVNNAPNHAMKLVWWRPCHCHHRAQTSQCVQLPPLTWEENTAVSQVSPYTAWGPHGNCFFTPLAFAFEVWWVNLIGSASVTCPCLNWKGGSESIQTSWPSRVGGRLCFLQNKKRVQRQDSLPEWPMPTLAGQMSSAEVPWGFRVESGLWGVMGKEGFIQEVRFDRSSQHQPPNARVTAPVSVGCYLPFGAGIP